MARDSSPPQRGVRIGRRVLCRTPPGGAPQFISLFFRRGACESLPRWGAWAAPPQAVRGLTKERTRRGQGACAQGTPTRGSSARVGFLRRPRRRFCLISPNLLLSEQLNGSQGRLCDLHSAPGPFCSVAPPPRPLVCLSARACVLPGARFLACGQWGGDIIPLTRSPGDQDVCTSPQGARPFENCDISRRLSPGPQPACLCRTASGPRGEWWCPCGWCPYRRWCTPGAATRPTECALLLGAPGGGPLGPGFVCAEQTPPEAFLQPGRGDGHCSVAPRRSDSHPTDSAGRRGSWFVNHPVEQMAACALCLTSSF